MQYDVRHQEHFTNESLRSAENAVLEIQRERLKQIDSLLRLKVEAIMGRAVTSEEISRHGLKVIWPDGTIEYRWRTRNAYVVLLTEKPTFTN